MRWQLTAANRCEEEDDCVMVVHKLRPSDDV